MSLPVINLPTYEMTLPDCGKKIKYRPFTVKEQKILLSVRDLTDGEKNSGVAIVDNIKEVIRGCTFGALDVNKLSMVDFEYIFIQLRIKSKGEILELSLTCKAHDEHGNSCGHKTGAKYDLRNVAFVKPDGVKDIIDVTTGIKLKLKMPTFKLFESLKDSTKETEDYIILKESIDAVIDTTTGKEEIIDISSVSLDEFIAFIDNLPVEKYSEIMEFAQNMPKNIMRLDFTCPKCGNKTVIEESDILSFFG